jgi:hypothetical protein
MPYTSPATQTAGGIGTAAWANSVKAATDFLANPPACRVYHTAAQSVANDSQLILAFNSERFDTDNMHSTVTNNSRITFNTAGVYVVTAAVEFIVGTYEYLGVNIRLNGGSFIAVDDAPVASAVYSNGRTVSTLYKFNAGDYVEVRVFQRNAAAAARNVLRTANYSPEFSAVWVGAGT